MRTPPPVPPIDPAETHALTADGAVRPLGALDPDRLPAARVVVAARRSGDRPGRAAVGLAAAGIDARNLVGGTSAGADSGRPADRDPGSAGQVV